MTEQRIPLIHKKILANGLTVLVRTNKVIPKVSTQLWYNVGSKDENRGQKGFAHLIEHMIFKGTKTLSESDINLIVYKLSGSCNAFTSYDFTGYLFNMPSHHWEQALPIMADCMRNCSMRQEFLNSELKAVIQELKMYRDNYPTSLIEHMLGTIFYDHPYHYPIIGFKQDLWQAKTEKLNEFYSKHYIPNNATLIIVGDIDYEKAFDEAEKNFSSIAPDLSYKKNQFHHATDLINSRTTLYRDVAQPIVMVAWQVPGARSRNDYVLDVMSWILGSGKGSRLQRILIDELQLVTELESFNYDLFEQGLFFVYFQPKKIEEIETITSIIEAEINSIKNNGIQKEEIERAVKKAQMSYFSVLEDNEKQAYAIGQSYLATGDENYLFNYITHTPEQLPERIDYLIKTYFHKTLINRGLVLPIDQQDKQLWQELQLKSDDEDNKILSQVSRELPVEEGAHVHSIPVKEPKKFDFPKAEKASFPNGLKLFYYHNPNIPTIDILINFKAKHYYEPEDKQGLYYFMSSLLQEGTKHKTEQELARAVESHGMSLHTAPGVISLSLLKKDLPYALTLLHEILTEAIFTESAITKVREQIIAQIKEFWDTPLEFVGQLAAKEVYRDHPYHKQMMGTLETINAITRTDILNAYKEFITPQETCIAIVGDLSAHNVPELIQKHLVSWKGPKVPDITFPKLYPLKDNTINRVMARDQLVLAFAGLSVARKDKAFDAILLFDQILTGGVLGGMNSRLFQLREHTGLFYTIGGSLLHHADEQPGMIFIRTLISQDQLNNAEKAIAHVIDTASDSIMDIELEQAKNALINSFVDNFETNKNIATTFLLLERFGLPDNYFDYRPEQLRTITKEHVMKTVKPYIQSNQLVKIRIGRM